MAKSSDFGTFGRFDETPVAEMSPEMRDAYDFTRKLRGLVPGPHKIWLANPKLSKTIVPTGAYFQTQAMLPKAETEIVTNLINARWLAAYGTYEHEKIGEEQGHLPAEKVERSSPGCRPPSKTPGRRSCTSTPLPWRRRGWFPSAFTREPRS